ncbi:hypothetical protein CHLRE_12g509100v5 [Chlamydomonas reinhardtii]|uniref:Uncharacterized protein n=1 Tax=Chlamydomonas reinhardtii TaxID=3055 RepID=A8IKF1_CHLRE|nr:uncharacterized protein CHLRE_12g509100v5 [Chlamydomonas reinhardtii]PNW74804.1 hypothetical protein CHLRE_12g509100v5 [Chlamydomonas reinhardtii]|eukprot:XP_001691035.1 predicted protein [Chlamydomonas reinhardtii]
MSGGNGADSMAVVDAENWRIRVRKEQSASKSYRDDWSFLIRPETPGHLKLPHARATVKYHSGGGGYTLLQKKIPLVGSDADKALEREQEYLTTASLTNSRPSTALQATLYSHSRRMEHIASTDCALQRTSRVYGSRHTLEQFGVSQFGIRETRSKLPPH